MLIFPFLELNLLFSSCAAFAYFTLTESITIFPGEITQPS